MKNERTTVHNSVGPSLATLLTVAFVVLKLTGHITWSWLWVLSPLWIGFLVGVVILLLAVVLIAIGAAATGSRR